MKSLINRKKFPKKIQLNEKDCGPTCLQIIGEYYGVCFPLEYLLEISETTRQGTNLYFLKHTANKIGFESIIVTIDLDNFIDKAVFPCIIHWKKGHYIVVYRYHNNNFYVSDPAIGLLKYSKQELEQNWIESSINKGYAIFLEPKKLRNLELKKEKSTTIKLITENIIHYKSIINTILISSIIISLLNFISPFLIQSIIDIGISYKSIDYIFIILIGYIFIFLGRFTSEIIKSWGILHVGSRININLLSNFFSKLSILPASFFDSKMSGDILQKIDDHDRVEYFFTQGLLNSFFSIISIIVFSCVLLIYSKIIFFVFLFSTLLYLLWIFLFLKKRKNIDYQIFEQSSKEKNKIIEFINGMHEIKLHNAQKFMLENWRKTEISLFKIGIKSLALEQKQILGANLIQDLKNAFLIFCSAYLVIKNVLSIGEMLAIQFILGNLRNPISQLVDFLNASQNTKISIDRLDEVYNKKNEEKISVNKNNIELNHNVVIKNLTFRYSGNITPTLINLNFSIPKNKLTAIVGSSGSGKTTLLKILLKFYDSYEGNIFIDNTDIKEIAHNNWRSFCGTVMQEGYIFNTSIENNVALGEKNIDNENLKKSCIVANIDDFINSLPLGYKTLIGNEGVGLSTGQKQRILIARAIYKNPNLLLFDEATSALDTKNEREVMDKLVSFLKNRTSLIIAHRLSTVKNADNIIVLDKGQIVEEGNHDNLIQKKGTYYQLVKNQLEISK